VSFAFVKPIFALSTCWNSSRHKDGYEMLREMADLGFTHVELSHGIRVTLVPGVLKAIEEGVVQVSSVHNFCPLPPGVNQAAPNLYEPSARDYQEREQWLRYTKRSMDFAAQVQARVVVLHLGSVRFFWCNPANALRHYVQNHPMASPAQDAGYPRVLAKARARLRKKMDPFWAQTKAGLANISDYAAGKNLRLGLENRERFDELPPEEEFVPYFDSLPAGGPAGYWHDTGHARIKELLGVIDHQQHLASLAPHLIGFHLHDVTAEGEDHQPVGSGVIDFEMLSRFWRPEHILVLELNPRVSVEDVLASKARIEALLG
jgi:sugar phosphate isomerase/epimerase